MTDQNPDGCTWIEFAPGTLTIQAGPYAEGAQAKREGRPLSVNPYGPGSSASREWGRGWHARNFSLLAALEAFGEISAETRALQARATALMLARFGIVPDFSRWHPSLRAHGLPLPFPGWRRGYLPPTLSVEQLALFVRQGGGVPRILNILCGPHDYPYLEWIREWPDYQVQELREAREASDGHAQVWADRLASLGHWAGAPLAIWAGRPAGERRAPWKLKAATALVLAVPRLS